MTKIHIVCNFPLHISGQPIRAGEKQQRASSWKKLVTLSIKNLWVRLLCYCIIWRECYQKYGSVLYVNFSGCCTWKLFSTGFLTFLPNNTWWLSLLVLIYYYSRIVVPKIKFSSASHFSVRQSLWDCNNKRIMRLTKKEQERQQKWV